MSHLLSSGKTDLYFLISFLQGRRCGKPDIRKEKVKPKFGSQNKEGAGFGDKVRRH